MSTKIIKNVETAETVETVETIETVETVETTWKQEMLAHLKMSPILSAFTHFRYGSHKLKT